MVTIIKYEDINEKDIVNYIKEGKVFVYPTDTIYGLGCDATNKEAVIKIRLAKDKSSKPFSVIAPSKTWILQNFEVNRRYVEKLPGPFTYILKNKKKNLVVPEVCDTGSLGIRIPDHDFTRIVQKSKKPFVTTSVNKVGKRPVRTITKIPRKILKYIDIIIDAGELDNSASTIIDMREEIPKIIKR